MTGDGEQMRSLADLDPPWEVDGREHQDGILARIGIDFPALGLDFGDPAHDKVADLRIVPGRAYCQAAWNAEGQGVHGPCPECADGHELVHAIERAGHGGDDVLAVDIGAVSTAKMLLSDVKRKGELGARTA
jgi:hypothetical protein